MFADIIDATNDATVLEHNMHVRHPDGLAQGYWGQGRVTLAGDAAHPLRPASGISAVYTRDPLVCKPSKSPFLGDCCLPLLSLLADACLTVTHAFTLIP